MRQIKLSALLQILLMCFCSSYSFAIDKIVIATTYIHNPPFVYCHGSSIREHFPGVTVELIQQAAAHYGIEIELQRVPWARALYSLRANQVDAIFHASYKDERAEFGVYPMDAHNQLDRSKRIVTRSYYLYVPRISLLDWDGSAFTWSPGGTFSVGIMRKASIFGMLERHENVVIQEVDLPLQNFEKLKAGRINALAELESFGDAELKKSEFQGIEKHPIPLATKDYYLLFSKRFYQRYPEVTHRIWGHFQLLRQSGSINTLFKKYSALGQADATCLNTPLEAP